MKKILKITFFLLLILSIILGLIGISVGAVFVFQKHSAVGYTLWITSTITIVVLFKILFTLDYNKTIERIIAERDFQNEKKVEYQKALLNICRNRPWDEGLVILKSNPKEMIS